MLMSLMLKLRSDATLAREAAGLLLAAAMPRWGTGGGFPRGGRPEVAADRVRAGAWSISMSPESAKDPDSSKETTSDTSLLCLCTGPLTGAGGGLPLPAVGGREAAAGFFGGASSPEKLMSNESMESSSFCVLRMAINRGGVLVCAGCLESTASLAHNAVSSVIARVWRWIELAEVVAGWR
jgi:hypothetical protein